MLTIILGILVAGLIFFILLRVNASDDTAYGVITLSVVIVIVSIIAGLFVPISGYYDWKPAERKDLVSLSDSSCISGAKGIIFISISSSNIYTYRYEVDSEFGTDTSKEFVTETVDGECVVEVEDESIDTAYLQVYTRKAQKSIWTFGLFTEETQYIFYVPPGSISKDVKLS